MARPKKSTRFRVSEFTNASGNTSFRVSGQKPDGERIRQNFSTRPEAEQRRADLETDAAGVPTTVLLKRTRLTDEQLSDAEAATEMIGDQKLSAIVTHYQSLQHRLNPRGIDIDSAIAFAESHYRSELTSVTIFNARAEFIRSRAGKAPRTIDFYEFRLNSLLSPDPVSVRSVDRIKQRSRRRYRRL